MRVFGRDADFDGVTVGIRGFLGGGQGRLRQRQTSSQPELLPDEVQAGDQFGHSVLHLESCVDLEEGKAAVRSEQEFGRGRVAEACRLTEADRHRVQIPPLVRRQPGCRSLLHQLLVSALERAVSLTESDDATGHVAQQFSTSMCRAGRISRSR